MTYRERQSLSQYLAYGFGCLVCGLFFLFNIFQEDPFFFIFLVIMPLFLFSFFSVVFFFVMFFKKKHIGYLLFTLVSVFILVCAFSDLRISLLSIVLFSVYLPMRKSLLKKSDFIESGLCKNKKEYKKYLFVKKTSQRYAEADDLILSFSKLECIRSYDVVCNTKAYFDKWQYDSSSLLDCLKSNYRLNVSDVLQEFESYKNQLTKFCSDFDDILNKVVSKDCYIQVLSRYHKTEDWICYAEYRTIERKLIQHKWDICIKNDLESVLIGSDFPVIHVVLSYVSPKGRNSYKSYVNFTDGYFSSDVFHDSKIYRSGFSGKDHTFRYNKNGISMDDIEKERRKMSKKLRYEVLKRDHFRCCICGRGASEDGVKLHVDHIVPVSKGGKTTIENLRTLCSDCNLGKSDQYDENSNYN